MRPLQRLYDSDNHEVVLFPMEYLHVSQGEHQQYAIDFLGWNSLGRVYNCPCYAPFSGSVVYTGNDHNMIYWSGSQVRFVDGTLDYATVLVAHSETSPASVGTSFVQGTLWYHTGNYGVSTGDHLHIEVARGHVSWDQSGMHLESPYHLYNMMAINDTVIDYDGGFTWFDYQGHNPTYSSDTNKFKWVIYTNKIRQKRTGV